MSTTIKTIFAAALVLSTTFSGVSQARGIAQGTEAFGNYLNNTHIYSYTYTGTLAATKLNEWETTHEGFLGIYESAAKVVYSCSPATGLRQPLKTFSLYAHRAFNSDNMNPSSGSVYILHDYPTSPLILGEYLVTLTSDKYYKSKYLTWPRYTISTDTTVNLVNKKFTVMFYFSSGNFGGSLHVRQVPFCEYADGSKVAPVVDKFSTELYL